MIAQFLQVLFGLLFAAANNQVVFGRFRAKSEGAELHNDGHLTNGGFFGNASIPNNGKAEDEWPALGSAKQEGEATDLREQNRDCHEQLREKVNGTMQVGR